MESSHLNSREISKISTHPKIIYYFIFKKCLWTDFICIHNLVVSSIHHKPCRPWIDADGHFFSREVSDFQLFWQEDRRKYSNQSFSLKYFNFDRVPIDQALPDSRAFEFGTVKLTGLELGELCCQWLQ